MEIIYVLVPLGIMLLAAAIGAFFWAVKNDQFDDLDGPAYSILFDDPEEQHAPLTPTNEPKSKTESTVAESSSIKREES